MKGLDPRAANLALVADERGTLMRDAPERVALVYPSPYATGMSSLGFQAIYGAIHDRPNRAAERAFLPDDVDQSGTHLSTCESSRRVGDFPVVAFSVAFEPEIAGVIQCLELAGIPPLAQERGTQHPFVLAGGPLTFSNPLPLAPFVDSILMGEADETIHGALDCIFTARDAEQARNLLARDVASAFVPALHGEELPELGRASDSALPAYSRILTPNTELRNMFLVEAARGCSRSCQYCVMRRSTNGGMRVVPMEHILERIPSDARRVGLVGAAVSDHPKIVDIVDALTSEGREVGLSSLRPNRLNDRFAAALRRGGCKTLTTAADGASQRLRDAVERRTTEAELREAARLAREHAFECLKLYVIVGLPGETDADMDELIAFSRDLSHVVPVSLGVAPFVAKRNTPLDGAPFAGIDVIERRLDRLRAGVQGRVDVRATSARWAWIEYVLAQGRSSAGLAALQAVRAGGKFRAWKQALDGLGPGNGQVNR